MKYFFINMTAFSVFIKLFLFYKQLYLKFIHRLLQCSDAVQNLFPSSFPHNFSSLVFLYFNTTIL